jgi:hypothetical protein
MSNEYYYVYYIDGEKFTTKESTEIELHKISSLDENTPVYENLLNGFKLWCNKWWIYHRLTGPARILSDKREEFWLDGKYYLTIKEWIKDHPNPDLYFDAIGIITETDKILWYLKN